MFLHLVQRIEDEIDVLKRTIKTHDTIRELLLNLETRDSEEPFNQEALSSLKKIAPDRLSWRVFDHSAAVSRLYSCLETFTEDLIKEYLVLLPNIFSDYKELPDAVMTQHRVGAAQVLHKLSDGGPYGHLTESRIVGGIAAGQSGQTYYLLTEAFLIDPQNYRYEQINKVFGYCGFGAFMRGVEQHPTILVCTAEFDSDSTLRSLLRELVEERNLVSHNSASQVWGDRKFALFANLIIGLAKAMAEIVTKVVTQYKIDKRLCHHVGTVIHRYSGIIRGVKGRECTLSEGDTITVLGKHGAFYSRVVSLALQNDHYETLNIIDNQLFGVALNPPVQVGDHLVR